MWIVVIKVSNNYNKVALFAFKIVIIIVMSLEEKQKPILVYFKIRGHAQVIRSVMLEIGVEFEEIFVTHDGYLDPSIIKQYDI